MINLFSSIIVFFCAQREIDFRTMEKKAMHFLQQREINIGGGGGTPKIKQDKGGGGCNSYKYG